MATPDAPNERGTNYGGENDGFRVQYSDGTWGFVQSVATGIGVQSSDNTSIVPVSASGTFTGVWEKNNQSDVMVSLQTDTSGTLYFDFSVDGINSSAFPVEGFEVTSGIHEFHTAVKGPR